MRDVCAVLLLAPLVLGCDGAAASASRFTTVDTLPSGTVHVSIAPDARQSVPRWRIVEDLRIGAMDGPGPDAFGDARGIEVDGEGRIYVLDAQSQEIRVFGRDGAHLRTVGRQGSGPGEFRRANGLALGPDDVIYVNDQANQRLSALLNGGDSVVTYPIRTSHFGWVWDGAVDAEARVYDRVYRPIGEDRQTMLRRFDPATGRVDSLPLRIEFEGARNVITTPRGSAGVPFSASLISRIDREGRLWFASTNRYRIHRADVETGDTLLVIDFDAPPVAVSEEERNREIAQLDSFVQRTGGTTWDQSVIPTTKPILQQFELDDQGRLWVRMNSADSVTAIDVFAQSGQLLATTSTALPFWSYDGQLRVRGDHLYAIVRDELDVQYVVRARIERDE